MSNVPAALVRCPVKSQLDVKARSDNEHLCKPFESVQSSRNSSYKCTSKIHIIQRSLTHTHTHTRARARTHHTHACTHHICTHARTPHTRTHHTHVHTCTTHTYTHTTHTSQCQLLLQFMHLVSQVILLAAEQVETLSV
jgi:hypothetical protein